MTDKTLLACLVVIWSHDQKCISAIRSCFLRHHNCSLCAIRTGTCNDRNPSSYFVNCKFDGLKMFSMCQCRRLACSATDNDCICAVRDLIVQKLFQFLIIYLSVFMHRGYNCNGCTFENCHIISSYSSLS